MSFAARVASVGLVSAIALVWCEPAFAVTFVVDDASDHPLDPSLPRGTCRCRSNNGNCTLRAAVQASNACKSIDKIELDAAGPYALTVAAAQDDDTAKVGDLDILDSVIILGNLQTVTGMKWTRVFDVPFTEESEAGESISFTVFNLIVDSGSASLGRSDDGQGGCLRVRTGWTLLDNVYLSDCTSSGAGGAIYVENSQLQLIATQVGQSHAMSIGGGLFATDSEVSIMTSWFQGNHSYDGGGIAAVASSGADYMGGHTMIDHTVIEESIARQHGGGVFLDAPYEIADTQILNNHASAGGGIWVGFDSDAGSDDQGFEAEVMDSRIAGNDAWEGGGIYIDTSANLRLQGCNVHSNGAVDASHGGGVYVNSGTLVATDSAIFRNQASGIPGQGGGIYQIGGQVDALNVTFSENSAANGGALFNESGSAIFDHVTVSSEGGAEGVYSSYDAKTLIARSILGPGLGVPCTGSVVSLGDVVTTPAACFKPDILLSGPFGGFGMNGGTTPTLALLPGNSAIDAASPCGAPKDQRGVPRNPERCDAGAYELP